MLNRNRKAAVLLALVALVVAALVAPAASSAKGTVSLKLKGPLHLAGESSSGGAISGTVNGTIGSKSYTKVKVSGQVAPPKMTDVFHLPGGTLIVKSTDGHVVSGVLHATYKMTGTGKYANAKGSGEFTASLTDFVYTFKGKVSF